MKIFIAGHNGFIGSHVVKAFRSRANYDVLCEKKEYLNLCDITKTKNFFEQNEPDCVIMCAGKTGGVEYNLKYPYMLASENNLIQHSIFDASVQTESVRKIIFIGSSCMYPLIATSPMKESMLLSGHPEKSSISYAMSKLMGVYYCDAINRQYQNKKAITVIPASVFGEGDDFNDVSSHVVGALIKKAVQAKKNGDNFLQIWGDGSPIRQFIYVQNLVDALLFLLDRDEEKNKDQIYNVAVDGGFSIRELALKILRELDYPVPIQNDLSKPAGAKSKLIDPGILKNLGWTPNFSFEYGLQKTINWYLSKY